MSTDKIKFCAVGDVTAFHKEPESGYEHVSSTLRDMDFVVAQNERHYSRRRDIFPIGGFTELTDPDHARALLLGNYDVLTFASNHGLDLGPDVLLESIKVLRDLGIQVIGAGENIVEARRPAFVTKKGLTVGFLSYCSVLRQNYWASESSPGAAPMRAYTHYLQTDYQPGTAPKILTFPYQEDLDAMLADIRAAKEQCDLLSVSCHWGLHGVKGALAMYQPEVAHKAIDAGADFIIGTHPHRLKAIEVYQGKPIFYSLGNFCFDQPRWVLDEGRRRSPEHKAHMDNQGWKYDPDYEEWYAVPPENRKSMLVQIDIAGKAVERVAFRPVMINKRAQPELLLASDPRFDEVVTYVKDVTEGQKIDTTYTVKGDEVIVELGG
ncbi:MAG TPA: CapA family protein [Trebonia sp.]|nr:CapA family protein [Trebonia sp.]